MLDVVQRPKDACLYEIRQKGQSDPCYVVVPNPKVRSWLCVIFILKCFEWETDDLSETGSFKTFRFTIRVFRLAAAL